MEKKRNILADAGSAAKGFIDRTKDKAVQLADRNDDGKFGLDDVAVVADSVGDTVKKGAQAVKESAGEKARKLELKTLQPVFPETLDKAEFFLSKFIRITERDKKHAESEVCQGSIGFLSEQKGLRIVNLFRDSIDAFGLTFYPGNDYEFYYVDPSDCNHYISLDEYFGHLKVVRIIELQRIAQDLGAKHFRVTYKEEQTSFTDSKVNAKGKSPAASAEVNRTASEKKYSAVEIAAEMDFPGHAPVRPALKYMQRDPSIQNLVEMRLNEASPLLHQKFLLQLSNSSGISESDAAKIDAVLKGMKVSGNTTVASEAKNESRRYLEYEIDF